MLLATLKASSQKVATPTNPNYYVAKIQPIVLGLDTFNILVVSVNRYEDKVNGFYVYQYAIASETNQQKITKSVKVPIANLPNDSKDNVIKSVAALLSNVKLKP